MNRTELIAYLDNYLNIAGIEDYGPQGLQVEAENEQINRLALAVDTSPATIQAAAGWQADMLLVHHGLLWRSVEPIVGPLGRRVRLLLQNEINLYAAHLALDAHPEVGNNAVLAQMFGVEVEEWWSPYRGTPLAVVGSLSTGRSLAEFVEQVEGQLNTQTRVLAHGPQQIQRVAILSGFGADEIAAAQAAGADTFLTGETSHANYWAAADVGLNVIYAGHYATETVGVQALGRHLVQEFGLQTRFFDFPTRM